MNTTIDELTLYENKINKFHKFKPVRDFKEKDKDDVLKQIKDALVQADDHLNHPLISMPESFRNEWKERKARCEKWLNEGIDNLYLEESDVQVPVQAQTATGSTEVKMRTIKVQHIISWTELFNEWITSDKPGIIQSSRVEGFTTRAPNQVSDAPQPAIYRVDLVFGTASGTPGVTTGTGAVFSDTGSELSTRIEGITEILLEQIQWKTVTGVASGDGFCRFRLQIGGQEILSGQACSNRNTITKSGFVLLLETASGTATFSPPLHLHTYKGGSGLLSESAKIELAIQDATGAVRGYQLVSLVLLAVSKYYQ